MEKKNKSSQTMGLSGQQDHNRHLRFVAACFVFVVCALSSATLSASEYGNLSTVDVPPGQFGPRNVTTHMQYFRDPSGTMNLEEVRALPDNVWLNQDQDTFRFGFSNDVYWLRLRLNKQSPQPDLLMGSRTLFDSVEAYFVAPGASDSPVVQRAGLTVPPELRPTRDRRPAFVLDFEGEREVWIRTQTNTVYFIAFTLVDLATHQYAETQHMIFQGGYFGILLFAAILFFVCATALRQTSLAWLGILTIFAAVTQATVLGFYATELWDENLIYRNALSFALGGTLIAAYYFFNDTLALKTTSIWAHWTFKTIAALSLAALLASTFIGHQLTLQAVTILIVAAAIVVLAVGIRLSWSGNRFALFTVLASSGVLVGSIQRALVSLQLIPGYFVNQNALYFGFLFMVLCLALGLGFEMRSRQRTLEARGQELSLAQAQSQAAANAELELEVKNRTQELENALTELAEANETLKLLNTVDQVTGVKNRYFFDTSFEQEWKRASREGYVISLLMLDVDHFKNVNDTYGHLVGDACLRLVAEKINGNIKRASDTLARFGGEEFVVLLPFADNDSAMALAEQVRLSLESEPLKVDDLAIPVQISVGVCTVIPGEQDNPKDLITSADLALYEAKSTGRNKVCNAGMLTVHTNASA